MPLDPIAGRNLRLDDAGYLVDRDRWTPEIGEELAARLEIGTLTELHWKAITRAREEAARLGRTPTAAQIADATGLSSRVLRALFPRDPVATVARIAGLSRPPDHRG